MPETLKFTIFVCFVAFVCALGTMIYLAAFPELAQIFKVTSEPIKFSLTLYFIGFIPGTLFAGPLSDSYGQQRILTFFLILFCLSSVLCGFSSSIFTFWVGRFFQGMGSAGSSIIIPAIVASSCRGITYDNIISLVLIMFGLGGGLSPLLGSLIFYFFGWRFIFFFLSFLGLLALGFIYHIKIKEPVKKRSLEETLLQYHFFIHHPFFKHYWLMIAILYGALYAFVILSPYIFRIHFGWDLFAFAWVGIAIALGEAVGIFLDDELIEKVGRKEVIVIGLIIIALTLTALFGMDLSSSSLLFLFFITLFIIGNNLVSSSLTLAAMKADPKYTGMASSILFLGKVLAVSLILILMLFLPEDLSIVSYVILITFLFSIVLYLKIRKTF